ncbi:hypothetical protein [Haladaptatus sp. T7]|uniref:hypothetical protein n=1 Tax=Haladaptatus sp. T7 TaxID=2029368 RepID=UPI0021A25980|nr:hypothetical protein [Haladaptatus sp. T7]GKZ15300.1 hypothetical protein HAL_31810 [Haladaptatus sp. T7]
MDKDDEVEELIVRNLSNDAEKSTFENGYSESVTLKEMKVVRVTLEPGWGVSSDDDANTNNKYCQKSHHILVVSGTLGLELDDGTKIEIASGSGAAIPPGHHGWTVGDEELVYLEFQRGTPSTLK